MDDLLHQKNLILNYYDALDGAHDAEIEGVLRDHCRADYLWRGFHPFNEIISAKSVADQFWRPLRQSLTHMQRRMDIFMAGHNEMDGYKSVWVVSMGHLVGLFDVEWLGIAPTGKLACLRYCEFNKIDHGKIAETAMYFDIPHLMIQAGLHPFPAQTAAHMVQPGPMTHDGLMFDPQPKAHGTATRNAINAMIADLGTWQLGLPLKAELARTWHHDMLWWGPAGIGATYTIARYAQQHAGPFRAAFTERSATTHICRLAEGHYGGFFGWPNFSATLSGNFMRMPATGKRGEFRVIDIYRRAGNKLAENWVFIDLLHFWKQQGVDILSRTCNPHMQKESHE